MKSSPCTPPRLRAIYVHASDYALANSMITKNRLSVFEGVGGSNGCFYEVNAPTNHVTFTKSLNDDGGKDWETFRNLIAATGLKCKMVWK